MNKREIAQKVMIHHGGIGKTADFAAVGLRNDEVAKLCKEGYIERIRRGFYQLPDYHITEEQFIQELLPQGIVCVESALFHYGYIDFTPRKWSVAMPRTDFRAVQKTVGFPIKAYYIQKEYMQIGKTTGIFNGVELAVYDRERTICDCFKYRNKLDSETFNKAVKAYAADENKNLINLSTYAKQMKLYAKIMNIMGVLVG